MFATGWNPDHSLQTIGAGLQSEMFAETRVDRNKLSTLLTPLIFIQFEMTLN